MSALAGMLACRPQRARRRRGLQTTALRRKQSFEPTVLRYCFRRITCARSYWHFCLRAQVCGWRLSDFSRVGTARRAPPQPGQSGGLISEVCSVAPADETGSVAHQRHGRPDALRHEASRSREAQRWNGRGDDQVC